MQQATTALAIPGRGLEGDRYASRVGTFTPRRGRGVGYDLTLIEAEVLDELTLTDGKRLGYAEARRNIVTRGIDLNALVGHASGSATSNASGAGSVSPAPTWSDSPTRACCAN